MTITNELLARGTVVREPVGAEAGYWAGAPGAYFDRGEGAWYLTYRIRRPRGVVPDRGGEVRIARSVDGVRWDDVAAFTKDRYRSASIERSCLQRTAEGMWHYFTSFVQPDDGRWCTAVLKAADIRDLERARHEVIFTGPPLGLEGVKDPWILVHGGRYHLFLSVAQPTPATGAGSHASLDIFNTGECVSATALAVSRDLATWEWQGVVFSPERGSWDQYCRRINSVVPLAAEGDARFLAFFDGSASHAENYEERCGLAVSNDLRSWQSLTREGPAFTSPHASTSLRYVDAQSAGGGRWHLFYEFARADGAHDMRMLTCDAEALRSLAQRGSAAV